MSAPRVCALLVRRDLRLAWLGRADVLGGLVFFVIVAALFPLGLDPEATTLRRIGPGVVWVGALLASLLSLPRLFAADLGDGTLEQLLLLPHPLELVVATKVLAHWLTSGLPLALLSPLLAAAYGLGLQETAVLAAALLLGTPLLSLLGAIGAALTLGLRAGGVLLSLLVLPLAVPVLVFGAGAVQAVQDGTGAVAHLSLLGAALALALVFAPWAAAAALRVSLE